jgi:predicted component of type VI protein secretion system
LRRDTGQLALSYKVHLSFVSEFQFAPDLGGDANAVAIQLINLENQGCERDCDVKEPSEPPLSES